MGTHKRSGRIHRLPIGTGNKHYHDHRPLPQKVRDRGTEVPRHLHFILPHLHKMVKFIKQYSIDIIIVCLFITVILRPDYTGLSGMEIASMILITLALIITVTKWILGFIRRR